MYVRDVILQYNAFSSHGNRGNTPHVSPMQRTVAFSSHGNRGKTPRVSPMQNGAIETFRSNAAVKG